jgi:hypothetical protein
MARPTSPRIAVRPALKFPNVTLVTNARAMQLKTNAAGTTVTEVVVDQNVEVEESIEQKRAAHAGEREETN